MGTLGRYEANSHRTHVWSMLNDCRHLIDQRQRRHGRRRLYAPRIRWASWLSSGGEQDEALPASGRKRNRQGAARDATMDEEEDEASDSKEDQVNAGNGVDEEKAAEKNRHAPYKRRASVKELAGVTGNRKYASKDSTLALRLRGTLADTVEWLQDSDDFLYATKLTVAFFLVTWPAFVASWNTWFSLSRGGTDLGVLLLRISP